MREIPMTICSSFTIVHTVLRMVIVNLTLRQLYRVTCLSRNLFTNLSCTSEETWQNVRQSISEHPSLACKQTCPQMNADFNPSHTRYHIQCSCVLCHWAQTRVSSVLSKINYRTLPGLSTTPQKISRTLS